MTSDFSVAEKVGLAINPSTSSLEMTRFDQVADEPPCFIVMDSFHVDISCDEETIEF
jgi:hypothetical protein